MIQRLARLWRGPGGPEAPPEADVAPHEPDDEQDALDDPDDEGRAPWSDPDLDRAAEPVRPPEGMDMLFCIGAQKAGTTWLSAYLGGHPECHFAPYKEMHYFDAVHGDVQAMIRWQVNILSNRVQKLYARPRPRLGRKLDKVQEAAEMLDMYRRGRAGERAYMRLLMRGAEPQVKYLCDFTPDYAYLPREVFARMAGYSARPRFIFILRDPVARLWSQVRMRVVRLGPAEAEMPDVARAMVEDWLADGPLSRRRHNDYAHTCAMLEACVPETDRMEVFMDDLFGQEKLDEICGFLGIAPLPNEVSPQHVGKPLDLPEDLRARMRESLDDTYRFVADRHGGRLPPSWDWPG